MFVARLFRLAAGLSCTHAFALVPVYSAEIEESLLRRSPQPLSRRGDVARVAQLELDSKALLRLRAASVATLSEFPLGAHGEATLELERFDPFSDSVEVLLMTSGGAVALALPDRVYFRGKIRGRDQSGAVLIADADSVRGLIADGDTLHRFGPDAEARHVTWSLRDVDPAALPSGATCHNEEFAAEVNRVAPRPSRASSYAPLGPYGSTLLAEIYLDSDQEFLELFTTPQDALAYLSELAAVVSAIYDADTDVRIVFRTIRLWQSTDPWKSRSPGGMLSELRAYWNANETGTPRDLVHFLSGKGVKGGIAYLDVLCSPEWGYGVSTVHGAFDVLDPSATWDVTVVAHELGHNFGAPHTHCYDPPVDTCWGSEAGCYSGPTSVPGGGGTIMSYCHLLPGGEANVNLAFGAVVSDTIRGSAVTALCIGDPCGDGILDPGEACDDGNIDDGDCCSADCSIAAIDGTSCDDGESCTESDQCTAGLCAGTPVTNGAFCDDGSLCTSESCIDGACVAVAAPDVGCLLPAAGRAAQVTIKNPPGGKRDGVAFQWKKGAATTVADFGDPLGSDDYELCLYDADADIVLSARIPAGGVCGGKNCWKANAGGYSYKDKFRLPDGIDKLSLRAGAAGRAKVSVGGKAEPLKMTPTSAISLPLVAQLRRDGRCWEATFSTASKHTTQLFKARAD